MRLTCVLRNAASVTVRGLTYAGDAATNVTPAILERTQRRLLRTPNHPLRIIKVGNAGREEEVKEREQW